MFGLKQKEKEIENEQIVENNVLEENVEETSLIEVQEESKTDKFDLAKILGKTEDGLKNEFYVYQIKELMSKLGLWFLDKSLSFNSIVKQIKDAKELGVSEIVVTPVYYDACIQAERKSNGKVINHTVLIDYPNGEGSYKSRLAEVKDAVKKDVDNIIAIYPAVSIALDRFSEDKYRINKLARISKKPFGVALDISIGEENLNKILKAIDGHKVKKIVLISMGSEKEQTVNAVKSVSALKGNPELCVFTDVSSTEDLSLLMDAGAMKIYTPFVFTIAKELTEKFGVEILND